MNNIENQAFIGNESIKPKHPLIGKIRGALSVALLAVAANSCGEDKNPITPEITNPSITDTNCNCPQTKPAETKPVCDTIKALNKGSSSKFYITEVKADGTISTTNPCEPKEKAQIACYHPKKRTKKTPSAPTGRTTTPPPANTTVINVAPHEHEKEYTNEAIQSYDEQTHQRF